MNCSADFNIRAHAIFPQYDALMRVATNPIDGSRKGSETDSNQLDKCRTMPDEAFVRYIYIK